MKKALNYILIILYMYPNYVYQKFNYYYIIVFFGAIFIIKEIICKKKINFKKTEILVILTFFTYLLVY